MRIQRGPALLMGLGLAAALAGCSGRSIAVHTSTAGAPPGCRALPDAVVADVNHLRTDAHLGAAHGAAAITCQQAIRDNRHPMGTPPVIGARLMTLTSGRYPHGVLVWVIATTPGIAVPNGGPAGVAVSASNESTTTSPRHYAFSIDIIDAKTGTWLQGLEGT